MLIGQDFPKMEFSLFGLDMVEPNALIGNLVLSLLAFYYAWRLRYYPSESPFIKNWYRFFLVFGFGLFFGGLGHSLWNYWGIYGKIIPWGSSLFCMFFLERAMISEHCGASVRRSLNIYANIKLLISVLGLASALIIYGESIANDLPKGFIIPSINAALGLLFGLLFLPLFYRSKGWGSYQYFIWSVIVLLPSTIFQVMKINLHPWMDRNDVAHVLMAVSFVLYWKGITERIKKQR